MNRSLTIGTAGHIDHGKTALVRALTGCDTDRLAEEKRRGISIELGFAELDLGGMKAGVVDVPGHERLVRTMIAGATGFDLFLLVVAADDGVMPQTREHLTVLRGLGIHDGVVALTKCDLADADARLCAIRQVEELLPSLPRIEVSSETGHGLDELHAAIRKAALNRGRQRNKASTEFEDVVLHIDRVFTIAGRGTVVTGTLWAGTIARGDRVAVLPKGREARVREVQIHGRVQERAGPRQRVALNLAAIKRSDIERGSVIVSNETALEPSYRLDVELAVQTADLGDHERVQVHHGTREVPGRVVVLDTDLAQLRLEAPLMARDGDRIVLRRIAPPSTIGGGRVLDSHPRRHGPGTHVERLRLIRDGRRDQLEEAAAATDDRELSPQDAPMQPATESAGELATRALGILGEDGITPRGIQALAESLGVGRAEAIAALEQLMATGEAIRTGPGLCYHAAHLHALRERIVCLIRSRGEITVAELRDALGISRRYAIALLEDLDSNKITLRRGEVRVLRGRLDVDSGSPTPLS
jgi:selenocysteine-specific elongation factor